MGMGEIASTRRNESRLRMDVTNFTIEVKHERKKIPVDVSAFQPPGQKYFQLRAVWPLRERLFIFYDMENRIVWHPLDGEKESIAKAIAKALSWELYKN